MLECRSASVGAQREEREEFSGKVGLKDPLEKTDDCPWMPGREEAVAEKIGNDSSQFFTSDFWVMLLSARYLWAPPWNFSSIPAVLQSSFSHASKVTDENLWKPEHPKLPLSKLKAQPFTREPLPRSSHPLNWTYGRAGWISPLLHKSFRSFGNVNIGSFC